MRQPRPVTNRVAHAANRLLAVLRNDYSASSSFRVSVDGQTVAERTVGATTPAQPHAEEHPYGDWAVRIRLMGVERDAGPLGGSVRYNTVGDLTTIRLVAQGNAARLSELLPNQAVELTIRTFDMITSMEGPSVVLGDDIIYLNGRRVGPMGPPVEFELRPESRSAREDLSTPNRAG